MPWTVIDGNEVDGIRKVIDFSADSAYSADGVPVAMARAAAIAAGFTTNGLAILCRSCASGRSERRVQSRKSHLASATAWLRLAPVE